MKIAVNTRLLIENKLDGIGWFTYHSLKRITQNHPEHHFYFLFDRQYSKKFIFSNNITPIIVGPQTRHPFLWSFWLKISVARKPTHIATVSEYSKNDLINMYNVEPNKISVVYNGSDEIYKPVSINSANKIKEKYSAGYDFFIFVGSVHPRKNLIRLIKAFDRFKEKSSFKHKLLIVGDLFFKNSNLFNIYNSLKFKNDIIFTGRMEIEKLSLLVASATAMTFVPYFEGFGIPILEALNCDTPVISSNITSMPEVAGDAALYIDPYNIDEISQAMIKIVDDKNLRKSLIEKGRIQRQKFSWDKTADKLWNAIEQLI